MASHQSLDGPQRAGFDGGVGKGAGGCFGWVRLGEIQEADFQGAKKALGAVTQRLFHENNLEIHYKLFWHADVLLKQRRLWLWLWLWL